MKFRPEGSLDTNGWRNYSKMNTNSLWVAPEKLDVSNSGVFFIFILSPDHMAISDLDRTQLENSTAVNHSLFFCIAPQKTAGEFSETLQSLGTRRNG